MLIVCYRVCKDHLVSRGPMDLQAYRASQDQKDYLDYQ